MNFEALRYAPAWIRLDLSRLALAGCALSALLLALAGPVEAQPAERVPLVFPEINPRLLGAHQFFSFVYDVPLAAQTEVSLQRTQNSPQVEAGWLSNHVRPVATLLQPSDSMEIGTIGTAWREDLYIYQRTRYLELFTEPVMAAIAEAPPVLRCRYFQPDGLPAVHRSHAMNLGSNLNINLTFWSGPVPDLLSPKNLRAFQDPAEGMHALIIIGPPIDACPETLGLALEVMATQFPGQVPAAEVAALVAPDESAHLASGETSDELISRLTGMSLAVTRTTSWGVEADRDFFVVDRLDPDGPAARAGFRSGDYLHMIGWTHHATVRAFAEALASAEERKAAVLSRLSPGRSDNQAALVVFADAPPGPMIEMRRESASGRTTLAERPWQTFSVTGDSWCAAHVEAVDAMDIGAEALVPVSAGEIYTEAFARIRAECPEAETISILRISSQTGAPIHVLRGTLGSDSRLQRVGIDGLPLGETVRDTRAIALSQAPLCDRLASHPSDPMRRYGLEGVAFIDASDLEEAFGACLAAVEADPADIVSRFHLGRVLQAGGLHDQALNELRVAADGGHGAALDLLGQMHVTGEGLAPDMEAARGFFQAARAVGFAHSAVTDPAVIDLTGVALPDPVREVFNLAGSMYIAMDPNFKGNIRSAYLDRDDRGYLIRMLIEIATLCGAESSLDTLRAARSSGFEDPRDIDHALFLYAEHLPRLLPGILAKFPDGRYASEGSRQSIAALVDRYDCLSPQLRQFAMNTAEMALQ